MTPPHYLEPDSGPMDLDGDQPLTADERRHLRRLLRDDDHLTWVRRKLRVFVPAAVAVVVAVWQLWTWVRDHIRLAP